jgi:hypothetical protein
MNGFQTTLDSAATTAKQIARERMVPAIVIALGISIGILTAVLVRSYLSLITNALIVVVQWSTGLLEHMLPHSWADKLTHLEKIDETSPGFDFGLGAFGAVFLLTQTKEIVATVTELISKWKTADVALLAKAFTGLVVGFAALGLSVYGLKKLAEPTTSPTFAFDAIGIPPSQVRTDGNTTFYISFLDEGGPPTFTKVTHPSVTVSAGDKKFLQSLKQALVLCGRDRPVELELRGFASGSLWTTAEPALRAMVPREAAPSKPALMCNPNSTNEKDAAANALACLTHYRDSERVAVSSQDYLSSESIETGKAFNVYLANRRRAAVAEILGVQPGSDASKIKLSGDPWDNYFSMQQAIAVDDSQADGTFKVKGILTRSVGLTITDPSACSTSKVKHVSHTVITLN